MENRRFRGLPDTAPFCFAPELALYFFTTGDIGACCYTSGGIYGKYPQQSVREAWEGAVRRRFSDEMQERPPEICNRCVEQARGGNHNGTMARIYDQVQIRARQSRAAPGESVPRTISFDLSSNCNLECVMCSEVQSSAIRRAKGLDPVKSPYDNKFIDQVRPYLAGLYEAVFRGGEPFLNRLNYQIWELLAEMNPGVQTFITTNGTVLTDRAKDLIETLKPRIEVSIESLNKGRYERIRKNATLEQVRANMDWLIEHNRLGALSVCPMKSNWQDLPALYNFCNDHMLYLNLTTVMHPKELSLSDLTKEELQSVVRFLEASYADAPPPPPDEQGRVANNQRAFEGLISQLVSWGASKSAQGPAY